MKTFYEYILFFRVVNVFFTLVQLLSTQCSHQTFIYISQLLLV